MSKRVLQTIRKHPIIVYLMLGSILIGLPFFAPGYILTLDLVFTPHIAVPPVSQASFPFYGLLRLLQTIIPTDVLERLILIAVPIIAGWSMHLLATRLLPQDMLKASRRYLPYLAGLLYMINPFIYERFMTGQLGILLGYALLPLFVWSFIGFLEQRSWKHILTSAGILWIIGVVSIHTILPAVILGAVFLCLYSYRLRQDMAVLHRLLLQIAAATIVVLAASSYWLIPMLRGSSQTAQSVQAFTHTDSSVFATSGSHLGVIGNLLSLRGFWAEDKNLFLLPSDVFHWWLLPVIVLWLVLLLGVIYAWRKQRGLTLALLICGAIAVVLASGTAQTPFAGLNSFLFEHLPFFKGYREPQKFVMILALIYSYLLVWGGLGLVALARRYNLSHDVKTTAIGLLALLPLGIAPLMPFGFHGQLRAHEYPADWYALNERLGTNTRQKVVFLPWHLYMRFGFTDRVIANPADKFFDATVISSGDPELHGAKGYTTTSDQRYVNNLITNLEPPSFTHDLQAIGVSHILLAKEQDYQKYDFLRNDRHLRIIQETPTLVLYEITSPNGDR